MYPKIAGPKNAMEMNSIKKLSEVESERVKEECNGESEKREEEVKTVNAITYGDNRNKIKVNIKNTNKPEKTVGKEIGEEGMKKKEKNN